MIVLIRANNRIEYCVVKKKDYDKRLFKHRGQLYAILPEDLRKLDFYIEDPEKKYSDVLNLKSSNECIIFNEGAQMPYDSSNFDFYRQERMLPFIDLIRDTPKLGRSRLGVLTSVRNGMDQLLPIAGMVFLFGVLGYALISGMVSS